MYAEAPDKGGTQRSCVEPEAQRTDEYARRDGQHDCKGGCAARCASKHSGRARAAAKGHCASANRRGRDAIGPVGLRLVYLCGFRRSALVIVSNSMLDTWLLDPVNE